MATAYIDHISTLEAEERYGAMVRLVRVARVVGLTDTDYQVLQSALDASGVPTKGATLTGMANLVLTSRQTTVVDEDQGVVDVTLTYEHFLNEGQDIDDPPVGVLVGEVRANISQVPTNKDAPGASGSLITVEYEYPEDYHKEDLQGQTVEQTGEIQVFQAQRTIFLQGIMEVDFPWQIALSLVSKVNKQAWSGGVAHSWMCTAVNWKIHDATSGANRYLFTFEFQHNLDTWDPQVVFIDENSGRPPAGLVEGTGKKTIEYHEEIDFNEIIGAKIQGG